MDRAMKKMTLILIAFLAVNFVLAQAEGIKKGDREINMSGNVIHVDMGESNFKSTTGFAMISFGRYITDRLLMGIAPGMSISQFTGQEAELDYNVQLFSNLNLMTKGVFIPYLRATLYESSFRRDESTYVQAGGGIKLFFAERASWDSQVTYGFNVSGGEGNTLLFLTGLSYIF